MSSEWVNVPIGSLCEGIFDGPHATPKKTSDGPVYLGISSLDRGQLKKAAFEYLSEEDFSRWTRRVMPKAGDVVFSYETRLGEAALIPEGLQCCLGRRMALMRVDRRKALPEYLVYAFLAPAFQEVIRSRTIHGSTVDRLPLTEFGSFPIAAPPLNVQREIVGVLRAFDDRITLLRETSASLEAIAQALFKSWFVDFDPVRAQMEGRAPDGMDEATATLFAGAMQETAAGLLPEGWSEQAIRSVVAGVFDGPHATPPKADQGAVFLGIKNLTGTALDLSEVRHIAEVDWARWTKRVTPRAGDIVFSYEATLGFFALIPSDLRCCLGRRLALIRPHERRGTPHFWYHQFVSEPFQRLLVKHTIQGATVDRLALKSFPDLPVLVPPIELRERFDEVASPIWACIHENQSQIGVLADLRDTLLPRLISGQLRLTDLEQEVVA